MNNNNLKTLLTVLVAVLAALAALPFAANFFGIKSPVKNGANNMEVNGAASTAELSDTYVTTQPSGKSLTYNGYYQELINVGEAKPGYWLEYSFSSLSGDTRGTEDTSTLTKRNADTYTIYVGVYYQSGVYVKKAADSSFTAEIKKLDLNTAYSEAKYYKQYTTPYSGTYIAGSNKTLFPYNDQAQHLYVNRWIPSNVTQLSGGGGIFSPGRYLTYYFSGIVQYRYKYTPYVGSVSYSSYVNDYTTLTGVNAGSYQLYFKLTNDPNLKDIECEVCNNGYGDKQIAYIRQEDAWNLSSTGDNVTTTSGTLPYNGQNRTLFTVKADSLPFQSDGKVYYAVSKDGVPSTSVTGTAFTKGTALALSGKNAGTYTLYIRQSGFNNIKDKGWTSTGKTATISKATGSLSANTLAGKTELYYNGNDQQLFTGAAVASGLEHGEIKYAITSGEIPTDIDTVYDTVSDITAVDPGIYVLYYKLEPTTNCTGIDWTLTGVSAEISVSHLINNATLKSMGELEYNGNAQKLFTGAVETADCQGHQVYYYAGLNAPENSDEGFLDVELITAIKAGTYNLYYRMTADDEHEAFNWYYCGISTTIRKAQGKLNIGSLQSNGSFEYSGTERSLFTGAAVSSGIECGSIKYAVTTNGIPTSETEVYASVTDIVKEEAGVYTLYYMLEETDNCTGVEWTSTGVIAVITKKIGTLNLGNLASLKDTGYTGKNISLFSGSGEIVTGDETCKIYYTCTTGEQPSEAVKGSDNTNLVTVKTPGTYYLWYRIDGTNYTTEWINTEIQAIVTENELYQKDQMKNDIKLPLVLLVVLVLVTAVVFIVNLRKKRSL